MAIRKILTIDKPEDLEFLRKQSRPVEVFDDRLNIQIEDMFEKVKKEKGAGGLGGKMTPCAVLVIQNGHTKLVNIKNQDTITKILDMVPDVIDKFSAGKEEKMTEEDVKDILDEAE